MPDAATRYAPMAWEACIEVGNAGEHAVADALANAGWTILMHGEAHAERPPPKLKTQDGFLGATDMQGWPPCGGRPWSVEVKNLTELREYAGWPFSHDEYRDLTKHDRIAGPVFIAIVDREDGSIWVSTIDNLQMNRPEPARNGKFLIFLKSYFIPLLQFLKQYEREYPL